MKVEITQNYLDISDATTFDPKQILESGQMFRFRHENGSYIVKTGDQTAKIECLGAKNFRIHCKSPKYFANYFDFYTDYDILISQLSAFPFMLPALNFGQGIRILKQPVWETLICFIISANNNIARIKKSVEAICARFGTRGDQGFSFPTPTQLGVATVEDFVAAGVGYRASYLVKTVQDINNGFDLETLRTMPTDQARAELIKLAGVGPKVADCVLLFGLGHTEVFPVDTWIAKVYQEHFGAEKNRRLMSKKLVERFGKLSGICQQYLFYYKRENK